MSENDGFDFDDIDDIMNHLLRMAGRIMSGRTTAALSQETVPNTENAMDEVIDGRDRVTYVLEAPGREEGDFKVDVVRDGVKVRAPDLEVSRRLSSPVDPKTAVTTYRNGVLSVSVRKA